MNNPGAKRRLLTFLLAFAVFAGVGLVISSMPRRDGVNIAAWVVLGISLIVLISLLVPALLKKRDEDPKKRT